MTRSVIAMLKAVLSMMFIIFPLAVLDIIVKLTGLVAVLLALPFAKEKPRPPWPWNDEPHVYPGWRFIALPSWAQGIWGSDKYGAMGNWFWGDRDPDRFWKKYEWLAIRNAASNWSRKWFMRYNTHGRNIAYRGSAVIDDNTGVTGWRFTWDKQSPWRCGLVILLRYGRTERGLWLRLGFKQYPANGDQAPGLASMFIPHPFKHIPLR